MDDANGRTALDELPPLRAVIKRFGLNARKSLGQHFLLDLNLTGRIARAAGDLSSATVIEIGPGPGGLTRALLATDASRVIAIERDARCIEALQDLVTASSGRLQLIDEDATSVDVATLGKPPRHIVANLPYNISTVLLIDWLRVADSFDGLTLMFQKEVAERIVAAPGSKRYGRLSVMTNWLCDTRVAFNVPARAFTPPPKVDSTVVQFTPLTEPRYPASWRAMETVTAAAFGQRRKMLRGALRSLDTDSEALLEEAEIAPTLRAEALTIEQFAALARAYARLSGTR